MFRRTHLAIGLAIALFFIPHINENHFIFTAIVLISSILPDLETLFAAPKRHKILSIQPLHWIFHKNRLLHSYTLLIPVSILIALYYPVVAFPFFLGYSFHLFIDAFSPQGIAPFWPLKKRSTGKIVPGGKIDKTMFYVIMVFNLALFIKLFI